MRKPKTILTYHNCDRRHDKEVEVGDPPKLLQQILWQKRHQVVFGRLDPVRFRFVQSLIVDITSDGYRKGVIQDSYTVALEFDGYWKFCRISKTD